MIDDADTNALRLPRPCRITRRHCIATRVLSMVFSAVFFFLLSGCFADLGERNNAFDPNGVCSAFEHGYPWVEYNYDDLDRMKIVVKVRLHATFYYIVLPDGSAAPSKDAIRQGTADAIASGSISFSPNEVLKEKSVVITGVTTNAAYSVYYISRYKDAYDSNPYILRVNHRYLGWYGWDWVAAQWHAAPAPPGGLSGNADGRFNAPRAIASDGCGFIYVADYNNHRIQQFTTNFTFLGFWGRGNVTSGWHSAPTGETAGGSGSGDYQFNAPNQIAVDRAQRALYVTDFNNHRVHKFDLESKQMLGWWGKDSIGYSGWHNPGSGRTGSPGGSDGMFNGPHGVAVDKNGYIFVSDYYNHRVQIFRSVGSSVTFVAKVGLTGSAQSLEGFFSYPRAVASDGTSFYVAESGNHRVQKLSTYDWRYEWRWGSYGSGLGLFNTPMMLTLDQHGQLYVPDWGNHRVQKFSATGRILWHAGKTPPASGNTDASFNNPSGIAVDEHDAIYIADYNNHRIVKYW